MRARRDGFTLVEVLVALLVVAIVVRIAVPRYQQYMYRARAAAAMSEVHAVRVAAFAYHADSHGWPPDVSRGVVPPELRPYLGEGFTFERDGYQLDWDHWVLPDGTPKHPETGTLVGVSVATPDSILGRAFVAMLGTGAARATISEHYTFIVVAGD